MSKTTKTDTIKAHNALLEIKRCLKLGKISYDDAKFFATPYLKTINAYSAQKARAHGLTPKKQYFIGFMR